MPETIMSTKGQITVPKAVRDALHLREGDRLLCVVVDGSVILQPRNAEVQSFIGALASHAVERTSLDAYDLAVGEGISDRVEGPADRPERRSA
ncbi:AbrB/MazE/SpoVT family DNA-binding domain-containing protein [Mangrovibrevibacter kandeliae]|uniref:AbrB/MazE/SpoVT family DNA-binding domain-containing protein n=1 Tax=Mangrovibrevibacter kandeliae TaxID=2968473 RepID=UPI002118C950|nr:MULTISPECIES: AbrB/MazE/SpoVT family DNA-binding domain-containing protein [unclassified Aurantimonas]MCQ8784228.1 AbrB/MazE/SpoVT family DNA-binding domain-containing protein [Aurantimonas sp. CSK15Z-1]MCW4116930.1 AbrB/MazE/SpoVT family DNA-binding domain-containing protein [Aurantimonas sp. MSK8Z-1]